MPTLPDPCARSITDREGTTLELEADHRRQAEIENAIRDPRYERLGTIASWPKGTEAAQDQAAPSR